MTRERVFQLELGEILPTKYYEFSAGTMIYPENMGRGIIQETLTAVKLPNTKIHGLHVFKSHNSVTLFFDRHTWTLHAGSVFGAYAKKAREVQIATL